MKVISLLQVGHRLRSRSNALKHNGNRSLFPVIITNRQRNTLQTIKDLVGEGKQYDVCIAIGPMIMMKFVCLLTKELNLPTVVSFVT